MSERLSSPDSSGHSSISRRVRSVWGTSLVFALAVAVSGCVGIPTSGSVNAGDVIEDNDDFQFAPLVSPPQQDASQQEILTDFVQASSSPENNYEVARQYLTPDAAEAWVPNASVTIREGSGTLLGVNDTEIDYAVVTQASVDSAGLYTEERAPASQRLRFAFEQVDGQWRIGQLEDGTVVSRDNFEAVFAAHALYYFDPSYRYLVPDVRWFPSRSNIETRIVSSLLSGQASWMQNGATVSAFPPGTELASPVEVRSGRATVDLSDEVASVSDIERARMQQQLAESLGTVSVSSVTMTVRGIPRAVTDPGASSATRTDTLAEPAPLVREGNSFGFATAGTVITVPRLSAKILGLNATAVSLARGQASAAVLGDGGTYLVTTGEEAPLLVDARNDLVEPSIDTWKFVWSVQSTSGSQILVIGTDGVQHAITSTLPADARVVSLDVSRDGARVLLYLSTDAGPRLKVAGVIRRDGVPTGLGELVDLPVGTEAALDATWVDDRSVATLAISDSGEVVNVFSLGGPTQSLGRADGGTHIVGGNGTAQQLRVLTVENLVVQRRASGWQSTGIQADLLATQQ